MSHSRKVSLQRLQLGTLHAGVLLPVVVRGRVGRTRKLQPGLGGQNMASDYAGESVFRVVPMYEALQTS